MTMCGILQNKLFLIMVLIKTVIFMICWCFGETLAENTSADGKNKARTEMALNIDWHLVYIARNDSLRFGFDPDDYQSTNHIYTELFKDKNHTDLDLLNKTDYKEVLLRLMRSEDAKNGEGENGEISSCLQNLEKFKALAQNRPLQLTMVKEIGQTARLACHFCEEEDGSHEKPAFDRMEMLQGQPIYRDPQMIRSPIKWYRIKFADSKSFRMTEVKPDLHDDDNANRIMITPGHTLVIKKLARDEGGTYFCHDTRAYDKNIKELVNEQEVKQIIGNDGTFRFLIHLNGKRSRSGCKPYRANYANIDEM